MKNLSSGSYFPILIDLSKLDIVVIGCGNVSTRKIMNLLEFNAKLTIISPVLSEEFNTLIESNNFKLIQRKYEYGDIPLNGLVFCSTGDTEVDLMIKKECEEKHALLNVADVPDLCNFIMPATIKHGDLTVSVASQGKAPFLVREMRKQLSELFSPQTADYVEIASLLREKMMETDVYNNIKKREKIFEEFFKLDFEKTISEKGKEVALKQALDLIQNSQ